MLMLQPHLKRAILETFNGLQVNEGGVFDREITKSLIIRHFDDVLKTLIIIIILP